MYPSQTLRLEGDANGSSRCVLSNSVTFLSDRTARPRPGHTRRAPTTRTLPARHPHVVALHELLDHEVATLPRLVRLMPRDLKFSPVAEPSPKLEGKFFLQLAANGALDVGSGTPSEASRTCTPCTTLQDRSHIFVNGNLARVLLATWRLYRPEAPWAVMRVIVLFGPAVLSGITLAVCQGPLECLLERPAGRPGSSGRGGEPAEPAAHARAPEHVGAGAPRERSPREFAVALGLRSASHGRDRSDRVAQPEHPGVPAKGAGGALHCDGTTDGGGTVLSRQGEVVRL